MPSPTPVATGFCCYVLACFFFVAWDGAEWLDIRFAMLPAIDQRDDMVELNEPCAQVSFALGALAMMALDDANLYAWRNLRIIIRPNPLWQSAAHAA